jgi:broad specificity phosphatase PhoE
MLYLICASEAEAVGFDSKLSEVGQQQAAMLTTWLHATQVYVLYTAPSQRALQTIQPFVLMHRQTGQYVRAEVRFELCDRVVLPEQKPHALSIDYIRSFGIPEQNVLGAMAGPEATDLDFERRVVDWFTNDFMEKYRDAPNPTAIVADAAVLHAIMKFLHRRVRQFSIPVLEPGYGVEYKSDGLGLVFSQLLTLV